MKVTEDILVNELRSAISDVTEEAPFFGEYFYLLLWLKARKMKVKETEKAIRNSWKWRKENDILQVVNLEPGLYEEYLNFLPADDQSVDKNGALVFQMSIGSWKTKGFLEKFGRPEFIRIFSTMSLKAEKTVLEYHRQFEYFKNQNSNQHQQQSVRSTGATIILNFTQFSLRNSASLAAIQAGLEATKIFSNYFCGHVEKIIFINVNSVVSSVLKPFLPLLSGVPIEIYGTEENTWKSKLHAWIDPSQLLPSYGGTKSAVEDLFDFCASSTNNVVC